MRLLLFIAASLHAQVIVSMDLMSIKGAAPQTGRGLSAYTWNIHACAIGPAPIPFPLVRMNFPEVRLYSLQQQDLILSTRVSRSFAARVGNILGYSAAAAGLTLQFENTIRKSPSQSGNVISAAGLAVPLITAIAAKNTPAYRIPNPLPDVIDLRPGDCADYTALAAFGKAPETIPPRRIDPVGLPKGESK